MLFVHLQTNRLYLKHKEIRIFLRKALFATNNKITPYLLNILCLYIGLAESNKILKKLES